MGLMEHTSMPVSLAVSVAVKSMQKYFTIALNLASVIRERL